MQNIHPMFIHFPIALLSTGLLLDLLGVLFNRESLRSGGFLLLVCGVVGIIAAAITGLLAESSVPHNDVVHAIMGNHKILGLSALSVFTILLLWRAFNKGRLPGKPVLLGTYLLLGIGGVTIMFYGADLGGQMVFEHGVGTSVMNMMETQGHDHGGNGGHDHGGSHSEEQPAVHESGEESESHSTHPHKGVTDGPEADPTQKTEKIIHEHEDGSAHEH